MKTEKLSLYYLPHRKELAQAFGWRVVLERWVSRIESDLTRCAPSDTVRLQQALHQAKLELVWLDHPNNPANREDTNHG